MRPIPYGRQSINKDDIREVNKALLSSFITQGPRITDFEMRIAKYCGARYAVAVSSGTAGLHIACLAAGLAKGDEAITSPITFVATPNAVLYTGAKPVFADIDYETMTIAVDSINKKLNPRTKALLPVNFAGLPCDLSEISKIAKKRRLTIIEDSCHALGAEYKGSRVGSCKHSDMCVFSFHPVKHITTGEGGMVTTNSKKFYNRLLMLRNHGIRKDKNAAALKGGWYYEMLDLGFNYRMTDIQAALGCSQMDRLTRFLKRRELIARSYNKAFKKALGGFVKLPAVDFPDRNHAWHLYVLRLNEDKCRISRKNLYDKLHSKGIAAQVHYIPVTSQPYYRDMGYKTSGFRNAQRFYKNAISLPLFPAMSDEDVRYVIKTVMDILCQKRA